MKRSTCAWLAVVAAVSVFIAVQVVSETGEAADRAFVAQADIPTVAPGSDVLAGIVVLPSRVRGNDYRRDAFGESWDDDNDAPGGRNGCDTRFLGGFGVLPGALQEAEFTSGTLR